MIDLLKQSVVIDVETSGPNFVDHQMLACAFVPVDAAKPSFQVFLRPRDITWTDVGSRYFQGFKAEWDESAVAPLEACTEIAMYLQETFDHPPTIIAHNVTFDFAFLRRTFHAVGLDDSKVFSHRAIDTHTVLAVLVAANVLPPDVLNSTSAFKFFGIHLDASLRHTAFGDAIATRELFARLMTIFNVHEIDRYPSELGPMMWRRRRELF